MIANKLIDNLDSVLFPDELEDIRRSQKFYAGDVDDLGLDWNALSRFAADGLLRLPYPLSFFEFTALGRGMAVMASEDEHGFKAVFFWINNRGKPVAAERYMYYEYSSGLAWIRNVSTDDSALPDIGNEEKKGFFTMLGAVLFFCIVIGCSNTEFQEHRPSEKLNKKRQRKGNCPLFTYKTLTLTDDGRQGLKNEPSGTHESPRVHLRRGHIRRLQSGRMTWVQPCVVGDHNRGVVDKDYRFQR